MSFLKNLKWTKILLSGFIFLIIATIIRQIEVFFTMNYYTMPAYFGLWSRLMMPKAGPPPSSFLLTSLLFSFLTGIVIAALFDLIKDKLSKDHWGKVIDFTILLLFLSVPFFTLPVYLLFNIPSLLLIFWLVSSAVIFFLSAIVFARIIK